MSSAKDFSLRQLQYLVAVADHLGFHKAAAACHVSQPALSAQILHLESVLGVALFERDRRRVIVTAAGEELAARARRILRDVDEFVTTAQRARDPFTGTLRIGVIPTIAPYLLPQVTPAIGARYPKLTLLYREEKTADVVRELGEGTLDAGIVALEADLGDCVRAEIGRDEFFVALPKGHPLGRKRRLTVEDLEGAKVFLLEDGHCFRSQALAICDEAKADEAVFRATSLATLAQIVSSGAGITLMPALALPIENRGGQLDIRPFEKPAPGRTLALVWRPRSPAAHALREVAKVIRWRDSAAG